MCPRSRGALPENVRPQNLPRDAGQPLDLLQMINRDLAPQRGGAAAQAASLGESNDAADLLGGELDDGVFLAHGRTYSTAKPPTQQSGYSPARPAVGFDLAQFGGMGGAETLGRRIARARKAAGMTQDKVAEKLGLTKGALSQWENDTTTPDLGYFVEFCKAVNASADEVLLGRRQDPLLAQLIHIYTRLSADGRDLVLLRANRVLSEEQPGPAVHDPYAGALPPSAAPGARQPLVPRRPIRQTNQHRTKSKNSGKT
jgi:transcriptional regulator with XRE-family HTH domain